MLPHWFWRIRFRTQEGGGETFVVAPHRAAAKQAIATPAESVTAYESVDPGEYVPAPIAAQRFRGYYPHIREALETTQEAVTAIRSNQ